MASISRRRRAEPFEILEDAPSTEDTQMNDDANDSRRGHQRQHQHQHQHEHAHARHRDHDDDQEHKEDNQASQEIEYQDAVEEGSAEDDGAHHHELHQETEEEPEEEQGDLSDHDAVEDSVLQDMAKLQSNLPGFRDQYRLIKRIGEGTFSTVYKAEDLMYDSWDNWWDPDKENDKWRDPVAYTRSIEFWCKPDIVADGQNRQHRDRQHQRQKPQHSRPRRRPKYVAVKKIYATSSPLRILNELELLHALRRCPSVCPLITAFRAHDQVVAVLPYFRHADFREYFRSMTVPDMAIYLRSLFTALAAVHDQHILHRDIKPTNFLYDPATRRGVLVDFGLAEREGLDIGMRRCMCHDDHALRRQKLRNAVIAAGNPAGPAAGYPKDDRRPSRRANRAGTRGFRAPEVLFKCTEQTPKIDVWSAGVILLTILSKRFPFFNSADDVEALIEIATIFGLKRMKTAAQLHGCMFETSIPTIGTVGFSLTRIILWSTCRSEGPPLSDDEKVAVDFLEKCLELDPSRRISARDALKHTFLRLDEQPAGPAEGDGEDELDLLTV